MDEFENITKLYKSGKDINIKQTIKIYEKNKELVCNITEERTSLEYEQAIIIPVHSFIYENIILPHYGFISFYHENEILYARRLLSLEGHCNIDFPNFCILSEKLCFGDNPLSIINVDIFRTSNSDHGYDYHFTHYTYETFWHILSETINLI